MGMDCGKNNTEHHLVPSHHAEEVSPRHGIYDRFDS